MVVLGALALAGAVAIFAVGLRARAIIACLVALAALAGAVAALVSADTTVAALALAGDAIGLVLVLVGELVWRLLADD